MNSSRQAQYRWNELRGQENTSNSQDPWVILFHGFGADCSDLFPLSDIFPTQKKWNWLFPQGPLEIPLGMGWTGRAWWPLDVEKMQMDIQRGIDRDPGLENPPELPVVREKLLKLITDLKVPWNQIVLGGFSQGGMMAMDLAFHAPEKPKGLMLLSSSLVSKENLKAKSKNLEGLSFYQSHGTHDPVLTFKNGQKLESFLKQSGLKGKLSAFEGAHEIPPKVIHEVGAFLNHLD